MVMRNDGRSTPTGWLREKGDVRAEELQFDNGYRVLAIQVMGQKAVIKGAAPWRSFIEHENVVRDLVSEWLKTAETFEKKPEKTPAVQTRPMKSRMDQIESALQGMIQTVSSLADEIHNSQRYNDPEEADAPRSELQRGS